MDLVALIIFGAGCLWLGIALGRRRKKQEMMIFPPDRRKAVHVVLETRDDLSKTF